MLKGRLGRRLQPFWCPTGHPGPSEIRMIKSHMQNHTPSHLSNDALAAEMQRFVQCERKATADLVAHLAEFERRGLHLAAGFPSLFAYCCEVLRLTEHETYHRIAAARVVRRFPVVLDLLHTRSLNVTTVELLAKHLTPENHEELLAEASGLSKRAVDELVARRFPQPDTPSSVRKVPARRATSPPALTAPAFTGPTSRAPALTEPATSASPSHSAPVPTVPAVEFVAMTAATPTPLPAAARRPSVTPLAVDRYEIKFTVRAETREKLRRVQDLLRHALPSGDPAEIFDRALMLLLTDLEKRKFAATDRPRPGRGTAPDSRDIAAAVRRAVWQRDGGRCAFVARNGRRCRATGCLEFHHRRPYAAGGEATVENLELRCATHNRYEAELFFGVVRETTATYDGPSTRSGASATAAFPSP